MIEEENRGQENKVVTDEENRNQDSNVAENEGGIYTTARVERQFVKELKARGMTVNDVLRMYCMGDLKLNETNVGVSKKMKENEKMELIGKYMVTINVYKVGDIKIGI